MRRRGIWWANDPAWRDSRIGLPPRELTTKRMLARAYLRERSLTGDCVPTCSYLRRLEASNAGVNSLVPAFFIAHDGAVTVERRIGRGPALAVRCRCRCYAARRLHLKLRGCLPGRATLRGVRQRDLLRRALRPRWGRPLTAETRRVVDDAPAAGLSLIDSDRPSAGESAAHD